MVASGLLLLAGCRGDASPRATSSTSPVDGSPSPTSSTAPGSSEPSTPVADPSHAVDAPGKLTGRLWSADMLVFDQQELSPDIVDRIRHLKGVADVERIGLGNVTIENHTLTVAAVDPATYRQYTPYNSAFTQAIWDRVAGGELAVTKKLGHQLQSKQGDITLGGSSDSATIHIGAYAPQVPTIDMVVNKAWIPDIQRMVFGNGLLISARHAPSTIQKPVQRIVGHRASVQNLDIASRLGLDPNVKQTAFLTGSSIADVVGSFSYTVLGGGRIAPDPAWVASHITTEVMPIIGPMTCNKAIFPQLRAALLEVVSRGLADKLHPNEYAGCYYPRFIAGTTTLSNHSFGLAMDFNVPENQRGTVGQMDRTVVSIFERWGFTWGGTWHYTDPMHFEMNQLVTPK